MSDAATEATTDARLHGASPYPATSAEGSTSDIHNRVAVVVHPVKVVSWGNTKLGQPDMSPKA